MCSVLGDLALRQFLKFFWSFNPIERVNIGRAIERDFQAEAKANSTTINE
ncbi:MAG: hypothetical protein GY761_03840 [Hyphomicrobiales bacterium]|nr:hypothetical protein [Hyphomicrobiales bacterium]